MKVKIPGKRLFSVLIICTLSIQATKSLASAVGDALKKSQTPALPAPLKVQTWRTQEGAKVYFLPAHHLPMLDVHLLFNGGSSQDQNLPGLAAMTSALLGEGTKTKSSLKIARLLDRHGAIFSAQSTKDASVVSLRTLTDPKLLPPTVHLFTEIVAKPSFRFADVNRIRNQTLTSIKANSLDAEVRTLDAFYATLYRGSAYAHPEIGTERSLPKITVPMIKNYYKRFYVAKNMLIVIVGDITRAKAQRISAQLAAALPRGKVALAPVIIPSAHPSKLHIVLPASQSSLLVGTLGVSKTNKDWPALFLANQILGSHDLTSRLMQELRVKKGLTYGVFSTFVPLTNPGPFLIQLKTRNSEVAQSLQAVLQTLKLFIKEGPSAQEVETVKTNILGSYPLSLTGNAELASYIAMLGFYHLPLHYLQDFLEKIQSLTAEEVRSTFAHYVDPKKLILVTAGPGPSTSGT